MGNPDLISYETIGQVTEDEPEAEREALEIKIANETRPAKACEGVAA